MEAGGAARRVYELRLARVDDARVRAAAAGWVVGRALAPDAGRVAAALGSAGFQAVVELTEEGAASVLRELYLLGLPPVGVAVVPLGAGRADPDAARRAAVFDARGGRFAPTWNWAAFCFGPFWYLKRGLWAKGLVLLALSLVPIVDLTTTLLVSLASLAYCGLVGNWDDYLWRVKRRQWW